MKTHPEEKVSKESSPKILGVSFNISATAEASDFKFGTQLGFAKGHIKITPRGKSGRGPGVEKLPKIWGFPFNISYMRLGLPRAIIKSHPEK